MMQFLAVLVSALCLLTMQARAQAPPHRAAVDAAFFETRVRPVLAVNCYGCHGPEKQANMLRVDSRESLLRGGKRGSALVPEKPEESLLIQAVRHQGLQMPLGGRLEDSEIDALADWVRGGAPWPATVVADALDDGRYERLVRDHWAFQPIEKTPLPQVTEARWSHPTDRFIYRALEEKGLSPPSRPSAGF